MSVDHLARLDELREPLKAAMATIRFGDAAVQASEALRAAQALGSRLEHIVAIGALIAARSEPDFMAKLRNVSVATSSLGSDLESNLDAESIKEVARDFKDLNADIANLEITLQGIWQRRVQSDFLPLNGMGALLERIGDTKALGLKLRDFAERARQSIANRLPMPRLLSEVQELNALALVLRQELSQVSGGNIEVDAFLVALAEQKATLRHVTPAVNEWLVEHQSLDAFSVLSTS
jgi:hypothetical protein